MKKRIAKKRATQFLQGKYPCGIRIETGCYGTDGNGLYEAYAVLPTPVALWVECLTDIPRDRFDTPLFLGAVDWQTGEWVGGSGWGHRWEPEIRAALAFGRCSA